MPEVRLGPSEFSFVLLLVILMREGELANVSMTHFSGFFSSGGSKQ